jgi:SnoaL-like domain
VTGHLGDPLPAVLAAYYADLDAGRIEQAAGRFSLETVYALPPVDGIETGPRRVLHGRDELLGWFDERGPSAHVHRIQLCVDAGSACVVEGVAVEPSTGESLATFAASAQFDAEGLISRYLSYMTTPAVDPAPSGNGPAPTRAVDVLRRYFEALDSGAFAEAADRFADDVVYSHPPYRHTGLDGSERVVFRGRPQVLAAFETRGRQAFTHRLVVDVQRGPHCIVEGVVEGLPNGGTGSFISSLTLDDDGRIARYVSFYCEPAVDDP